MCSDEIPKDNLEVQIEADSLVAKVAEETQARIQVLLESSIFLFPFFFFFSFFFLFLVGWISCNE